MSTDTSPPVVLLVEDSEDDAFFFERAFEKSGTTCSLQRAADGAEAVNFLRNALASPEQLPRVVFLDLKMPFLNGFEVLEWISTEQFPHEMRVIVLSGSDDQGDRSRASQLGAADYVVKPVRIGDLQRLLTDICPTAAGAQV